MAEKINKVGFSLIRVSTEQFATIEEAYTPNKTIEINLNTGFAVDKKKMIISSFFEIKYLQDDNPFIILETACHFKIDPQAWDTFYLAKSDTITIPQGFAGHLAMLNIGTCRGVLHAKTEGTPFNIYVLPTINVNKLVEGDITIDLNEEKGKSD